ncbi:hypothetical protein [Novosphingobium resinovorum]|nr:hypothetical protein [Novosphingobium resinovorum]
MHRIFTHIAAAALGVCALARASIDFVAVVASDISRVVLSAVAALVDLVPAFATGDEFRFANSHPRSIFETRRAGLA